MKKVLSILTMFLAVKFASAITVVTVKDSISTNTHWTSDKQYLLMGYVYVTDGATLTIDAGTIIKGDKDTKGALIFERGSKIMAQGTPKFPIIFTSNQDAGNRTYGDWGGIIICGKSPCNWTAGTGQVEGGPRSLYGGTDAHDNSGVISYVRIEFAGVAFSPNNEVNGLTFCSVGDATQVDHIQVSYSGDDSYEWFGGTVNSKYLISYRGWDDDFDTDCGYSGKNQFLVSLRDPYAADQSGSKAFESDSYQSGTKTGLGGDISGLTRPIFSNVTAVGPLVSPTSTAFDPQFVSAVQIRRGSSLSLMNSIIAGWPAGILIDESSSSFGSTVANLQSGNLQIRNVAIAGIPTNGILPMKELVYVINGARSLTPTNVEADTTTGSPFGSYAGPYSWFMDPTLSNKIYASVQNGLRLQSPFNLSQPSFIPTSTSPVCYNATHTFHPDKAINWDTTGNFANYNAPGFAPSFSHTYLQDAFFDKVNYSGAFAGSGKSSDNWTASWANWDPNNTDYSSVIANGIKEQTPVLNANIYPNPSNGITTVNFSLEKLSKVSIQLIDMTGKEISLLSNENYSIGYHSFDFNAASVKPGIYFIRVSVNSESQVFKLSVY